MRDFIVGLTTEGEVRVWAFAKDAPPFNDAAAEAMRGWDEAARLELAGDVPALDLAAAGWAVGQFYRACQLLVCRDVSAEVVTEVLGAPCPGARGPAMMFSVDLVFRFLPDLYDRARRLAPGDALVTALGAWARDWPLSSPGVALETPPPLEGLAECPALWRLHLDRVAARHAEDRWRDPSVAAQLRADLGAFSELNVPLAEALRRAAAEPATPSLSA